MDETVKVDQQLSDYDLYAALMLSSLLDSEQDVKNQQELPAKHPNEEADLENQENDLDVIWVPADKHPEIAPTEFANFIKTHGADTPTRRRSSSLHRRKSILSQSLSSSNTNDHGEEDELELNRTLSEKKRHFLQKVMSENEKLKVLNTHTFDRNSTSLDDSRIIAPKSDKSLLRRSAFSARGRSRKTVSDGRQQKRSVSQRMPNVTTAKTPVSSIPVTTSDENQETTNKIWDKSEGISLYDQPVNMSEWIDLGSASLESDDSQRGILSRVHDAESQLRTQQIINGEEEKDMKDEYILPVTPIVEVEKEKTQPAEVTKVVEPVISLNKPNEGPKRPGMIRSPTESNLIPTTNVVAKRPKAEKRTSWLGGLFQSNTNVNGNKKNTTTTATTVNNSNNSPLSGLATLFSRSLSMKSNMSSISNNHNLKSTTLPSTKKTTTKSSNTKPILNNNNNTTTTIPTPTPTTTNNSNNLTSTITTTTNTILQNNKKKRSSRLEIPPPSERTFFNTSRLPLHVERAIYRLSHMKLADPRRPLRQQVLISNLMFWYLSIQQNDYQKQEEQRVEHQTSSPPLPDPQQQQNKKVGKMSRLIHSAKKRKSEVVQFVQTYPLSGNTNHNQETVKKSNVQFSLAPIPSHHYPILNFENEEEEDDLPLSHYRS